MKRKNYTTFAAIHLGSEMLSMQITEYHNTERYKVVECCNRRIRLGEATFKNKIIPFPLVSEICEILIGFKRLMKEYGVEEYVMQATTAVRPAIRFFCWIRFITKPALWSMLLICRRRFIPNLWPSVIR